MSNCHLVDCHLEAIFRLHNGQVTHTYYKYLSYFNYHVSHTGLRRRHFTAWPRPCFSFYDILLGVVAPLVHDSFQSYSA